MRRVRESRRTMGASPHLSAMRRHFMLRQLTESTRQQTRARRRASGHRFRATRGTLVVLLSGRRVFGVLITAARQKFFAHDLAVLHRVNANFGELEPLFGVFVCYVGVVLHHEAVVRDEWPIRFEAVDLHVLEPPIDLASGELPSMVRASSLTMSLSYSVSNASCHACLRTNSTTFCATCSVFIFVS